MSEALLVLMTCAGVIVTGVVALSTVVPYMDGRDRAHRDKWIRAHALAWACYKRGRRGHLRREKKLYARFKARKDEA